MLSVVTTCILVCLASVLTSAAQHSHNNNWAVLVSTSRYWFNFRHQTNALSLYHYIRQQGIPDSRIILMLADDAACDPRNCFPGQLYDDLSMSRNLFSLDAVQVDYKGESVSADTLIRLLTNRLHANTPSSKRLLSDDQSHVLVYLNGHGGDGFLKFQDKEVINNQELADAFHQMHVQRRYKELLFVADTCQASSMYGKIYSPNIISIATSKVGQSSYSHFGDGRLGYGLLDRFIHYTNEFLKKINPKRSSLKDLLDFLTFAKLESDMQVEESQCERSVSEIYIWEYFSGLDSKLTFSNITGINQ
eukprot:TRINITY_DN39010_c0_g1_i1.p1 TRINITY_DN39010_c0_g1~~TRINITY_DN39010_c0_g1_i1.p1  ORF type:complete len:305 (+),score=40.64 TRINITY_DN39010_c0_g1_i1:16-930(+)